MILNIPRKRLMRILTTYQKLNRSPTSACRDILAAIERSSYYRKLEEQANAITSPSSSP